nr:MAG TPA: hypothetical protein [Caudoviricetes sp.]
MTCRASGFGEEFTLLWSAAIIIIILMPACGIGI